MNVTALVDPQLAYASAPGVQEATFVGLPPNEYTVLLSLPARARCGPPVEVYLGKVGLINGELRQTFDIKQNDAACVRGGVTVHGGALAPDRLLVFWPGGSGRPPGGGLETVRGWRSFVSPQGEFELLLPPGQHRLWVIDLETGLPVHVEDGLPNLPSGETRFDLELRPAIVSVHAVADPGVRLVGRHLMVQLVSDLASGGGATTVLLPIDNERWDFFVVPGLVRLQAFGKRSALGIPPLAAPKELLLELGPGERRAVEVPVVAR